MIALSYPNPNKKVVPVHTPPWNGEFDRARKMGIAVSEYTKRSELVAEALAKLTYDKGDVLYPYNASLFHKYGKARVVAICRRYDDYGQAKWTDDAPLLVAAHWEDTPTEIFNCTIAYLQKEVPHGVKEC